MMMNLLPPSTPISFDEIDSLYQHHTRSMVGAFTDGQSNAAAKRIGFDDRVLGHNVMIKFRLICLDHIAQYYTKMKGIT